MIEWMFESDFRYVLPKVQDNAFTDPKIGRRAGSIVQHPRTLCNARALGGVAAREHGRLTVVKKWRGRPPAPQAPG
jgi:hypothetical protein